MPRQHRRHDYSIEEKKRIVDEAYSTPQNVRSIGRKYAVQPKQIRDWKCNLLEKEESFKGNPKKKKSSHDSTNSKYDTVFDKLKDFYAAHRAKNLPVTMNLLMAKFKQLHREEFDTSDDPTSDAIRMDIRRWMK